MTETQTEAPPRVLSLTEAAVRLKMKPPNVAKFLARRGVNPYLAKAQGYFWLEEEIERVKAEREADEDRMRADRRRRRGALRGSAATRLGPHQREILPRLLRAPMKPETEAERHAIRRLRERGYVTAADNRGYHKLTASGVTLAGDL